MKIVIIDTETTGVTKESDVLEIGLVYYDAVNHNSVQKIKDAPKLSILVHRKELNHCQLGALTLNAKLIEEISEYAKHIAPGADEYRVVKPTVIDDTTSKKTVICDPEYVMKVIYDWLIENDIVDLTNYGSRKFGDFSNFKSTYLNGNISVEDLKFYLQPVTLAGKNIATFDLPILVNNIPNFSDFKYRYRMIDPTILYTGASDQMLPQLQDCLNRLQINKVMPTETKHRAVDDCIDIALLLFFHFKQTRYRTYTAFKIENFQLEIIEQVTFNLDTDYQEELKAFENKHKDNLISYDLSFHKLGSLGRLQSFHTELRNLTSSLETQVLTLLGDEMTITLDTIKEDFNKEDHPILSLVKLLVENLDKFEKNFIEYHLVLHLEDTVIITRKDDHILVLGDEIDLSKVYDAILKVYQTLEKLKGKKKTD